MVQLLHHLITIAAFGRLLETVTLPLRVAMLATPFFGDTILGVLIPTRTLWVSERDCLICRSTVTHSSITSTRPTKFLRPAFGRTARPARAEAPLSALASLRARALVSVLTSAMSAASLLRSKSALSSSAVTFRCTRGFKPFSLSMRARRV
jgi:hypothetical protein